MLLKIATLALLVESLVEVIKWASEGELSRWRIIALVAGMLITPPTGLDLFAAVGIPLVVPWIGVIGEVIGVGIAWVLTGMLICRGSGVVNTLIAALSRLKQASQTVPVELVAVLAPTNKMDLD